MHSCLAPVVRRTRSAGAAPQFVVVGPSVHSAGAPAVRRTRSRDLLETIHEVPSAPPLPPPPPSNECAVFWDYENISLGARLTDAQLERLCARVRSFGRLIEARLYSDSTKKTLPVKHRAMLERLGFSLIDCPTSDKKEMCDKKIILDACFFALPRATRQQPTTVVLLSGDGDFAHLLMRLRSMGVRTVAIGNSADLRAVSDVALTLAVACGEQPGTVATSATVARAPSHPSEAISSRNPRGSSDRRVRQRGNRKRERGEKGDEPATSAIAEGSRAPKLPRLGPKKSIAARKQQAVALVPKAIAARVRSVRDGISKSSKRGQQGRIANPRSDMAARPGPGKARSEQRGAPRPRAARPPRT